MISAPGERGDLDSEKRGNRMVEIGLIFGRTHFRFRQNSRKTCVTPKEVGRKSTCMTFLESVVCTIFSTVGTLFMVSYISLS